MKQNPSTLLGNILPMIFGFCLAQPCLLAQTQTGSDSAAGNQAWTTRSDQQSPTVAQNPTRTLESHKQENGRTVDKQSVERLGSDGEYQPYLDSEKETIQVDLNTVRMIQRTFARDPEGNKTLIQVTEQETHALPGGEQKSSVTTSNPDPNGNLQVVRRELQDTKQTSPNAQETKTIVLTPDTRGDLVPTMQIQDHQTRNAEHSVDFRKSTMYRDLNGDWQVQEVREGSIRQSSKERIRDERVLRPGTDGHLAVVEGTITRESETAPGEKRNTVETYSTNLPGTSPDGSLHLNQRVTTVSHARPDGGQTTESQVEQRTAGSPDNLGVTQKTIDIVRPTTSGVVEQRTIQDKDPNGDMGVVWVDTRQKDVTPSVKVEIAPPQPR